MPIYAYRCATCGHAKDVLQKVSDPVLSTCPACGAPTFEKQVTAAGFQLKGSGWYVTDFRGDNAKKADKPEADAAGAGNGEKGGAPEQPAAPDAAAAAKPAESSAAPAPAAAAPVPAAPAPAVTKPGAPPAGKS